MASVFIRDINLRNLSSAKLVDIRAESWIENRGGATVVLRWVERWCRRMGCQRIWGELSSVDRDHMDKLQHFYEKNGYTFKLYESGDPMYDPHSTIIGEIRKVL